MTQSPLGIAVCANDIDTVKKLVENNANINEFPANSSQSALSLAIHYNNLNIVKYLLENNANIDSSEPSGNLPLVRAYYNDHYQIMKLLIDHNADINAKYYGIRFGNIFLNATWHFDDLSSIQFLIENKANIDVRCLTGSPLHMACINNSLSLVIYLIEIGANINTLDRCNNTPLTFARKRGIIDIINYIEYIQNFKLVVHKLTLKEPIMNYLTYYEHFITLLIIIQYSDIPNRKDIIQYNIAQYLFIDS